MLAYFNFMILRDVSTLYYPIYVSLPSVLIFNKVLCVVGNVSYLVSLCALSLIMAFGQKTSGLKA